MEQRIYRNEICSIEAKGSRLENKNLKGQISLICLNNMHQKKEIGELNSVNSALNIKLDEVNQQEIIVKFRTSP